MLARNAAPTVAQLIGTWKLVSIEDTMKDGKVQPSAQFGPHPHGFIMYEPDGYMCATIANGDRPAWKDSGQTHRRRENCLLRHLHRLLRHLQARQRDLDRHALSRVAWTPAYVGSTQPRPFRLEGNKLIITVTRGLSDPAIQKRVLVWQRAK